MGNCCWRAPNQSEAERVPFVTLSTTAPNVYDGLDLHRAHDITLIVLACVAAAAWLLYLYLVLFRSGKTRTHWLKRRLADLVVVASIALIGFLVSFLLSLLHSRR